METAIQEIERRFLLRKRPVLTWDHIYNITQYYIPDGDVVRRLRNQVDLTLDPKDPNRHKLEYLYKKYQDKPGEFIEYHEDFDPALYQETIKKATSYINKHRYVFNANNLKFEVDEIEDVHLILLEVELSHIDQVIIFPQAIKDLIICEVTGLKGLSNFALSKPTYK